jgi:hypothetical protein
MDTHHVVLLVIALVIVALAAGGAVAAARMQRRDARSFEGALDEVNQRLAAAHAEDKGWEPRGLEAAARQAFAGERPGADVEELVLVQVVDLPGTDQDQAVFRVVAGGSEAQLTLGRRGDEWHAVSVE